MYRITKGDMTVTADTEAELQIAIACLTEMTRGYESRSNLAAAAPDWRVGGPVLGRDIEAVANSPMVWRDSGPVDPVAIGIELDAADDKPTLSLVPTESNDSDVQHIPVRAKQLDVLEAVLVFAEGVQCKGIEQLLGLPEKAVSGRIQCLKKAGLVELVPHSTRWRATQLARRAKLVRA